jgi:hypothetical protein
VISQLDHRHNAELEDIITSLPERDPYTTLTELIKQRIRQLLKLEMGDRKPSQFVRHLRSLAPDDFLHTIWSSQLSSYIHGILIGQPRAAWTPQPAVPTASPRSHPSRR